MNSLAQLTRMLPLCVLSAAFCIPHNLVQADDDATAINHAKALSKAFRSAAGKTTASVVTIIARSKHRIVGGPAELREMMRDPRFRELFPDGLPFEIPEDDGGERGDDGEDEGDGEEGFGFSNQVGSGVIVDGDGLILTNNHVVQNADQVLVRLADGREFEATDIRTDPMSDLAVLRIKDAGMLRPAKLGDSSKLAIGDWVIAIGSPFNLEATVSAGMISGKGRGISQIRRGSLIQTDAAINPGNSGGPLVNLDGEVVGINTAIASRSGGYQGIGFAIPVNRAKWVSRELLDHGSVRRAFLGIRISELLPDEARRLGRPARSGVHVVRVIADGPADKAGFKVDDIIIDFAGIIVRRPRDLQDAVEQKPLESKQKVKVYRDGMIATLEVKLGALPADVRR